MALPKSPLGIAVQIDQQMLVQVLPELWLLVLTAEDHPIGVSNLEGVQPDLVSG